MKVTESVGVAPKKKSGVLGKITRRQKHTSFATGLKASALRAITDSIKGKSSRSDKPVKSLSGAHNLFSELNINVDDLKKNLTTNCIPVSKDAIPKHFPKKDKRKLRHDTFMKKLEAVHALRQDKRNKKKRVKKTKNMDMEEGAPTLVSQNPTSSELLPPKKLKKKMPECLSKRPIPKTEDRRKQDLQDLQLFKAVMSNSVYKANPAAAITNYVRHKICESLSES